MRFINWFKSLFGKRDASKQVAPYQVRQRGGVGSANTQFVNVDNYYTENTPPKCEPVEYYINKYQNVSDDNCSSYSSSSSSSSSCYNSSYSDSSSSSSSSSCSGGD